MVRGDLDRIPEVAAASETVLVLKDFASASGQNEASLGVGRMLGRVDPLLTVNGELNPGLSIASGGLLRLRLLHASNARVYRLALEGHRWYGSPPMAAPSAPRKPLRSCSWPPASGPMSAELGAPDRFGQQFLLADQSHVLPLQELQLLQRPRDDQVPRSATGSMARWRTSRL
jgi:hypothetical protein